jgi:hypothetical protein
MTTFAAMIVALGLCVGACERPERKHNDGNQPSGDPSRSPTVDADDPRIDAQRNNEGAKSGVPRSPGDDAKTPASPGKPTD